MQNETVLLEISGLSIRRCDKKRIPAGNRNSVTAHVAVDAMWEGETVFLVFERDGFVTSVELNAAGECVIPDYCMAKPGKFSVSARAGERWVANVEEIFVVSGGMTEDNPPPVPEQVANYVRTEVGEVTRIRETDEIFEYLSADGTWKQVEGGGGSGDIWLPSVSDAGELSWTRSKSKTPPAVCNIMGAIGAAGEKGEQGVQGIPGAKGDKGDTGEAGDAGKDGADGYTPIKGVDYWTESDRSAMVVDVLAALPNGDEEGY